MTKHIAKSDIGWGISCFRQINNNFKRFQRFCYICCLRDPWSGNIKKRFLEQKGKIKWNSEKYKRQVETGKALPKQEFNPEKCRG